MEEKTLREVKYNDRKEALKRKTITQTSTLCHAISTALPKFEKQNQESLKDVLVKANQQLLTTQ